MHFSTFKKVQNALVPQHYVLVLKSTEFIAFGHILANYVNFVPVNMSKWLNGPCYVEIELGFGILGVKNLQKEL